MLRVAVCRGIPLTTLRARPTVPSVAFPFRPTTTTTARITIRRPFVTSSSTTAKSPSAGIFSRAWARYNVLLESHPLTTKIITASAIAAVGDINCQLFIEGDRPFDAKRAAIFTFLGGILVPPILHGWYAFLSTRLPGLSTKTIIKRLVLDQIGFAPTFLPIFFAILLTLEGNKGMIPEKIQKDWWPACKANWTVWVPAQLINFRFVPGSLQVLFANVIGLFWNSYLSYISHVDPHLPHHAQSIEEVVEEVVEKKHN